MGRRGPHLNRPGAPAQPPRHYLTLWQQPLHRWLIATIYHWYDMCVYRLPGFRTLENLLHARHRDDDRYVPLGCRQDLRCFHLRHQQRTTLATFEISTADVERLQRRQATVRVAAATDAHRHRIG